MRQNFLTNGRFTSFLFYLAICITAAVKGYYNPGHSFVPYVLCCIFMAVTLLFLIMVRHVFDQKPILYEKIQSVCFVFVSMYCAYVFGNISILLFLLFVKSFLNVVFLDKGLYYFQTIVMMLVFSFLGVLSAMGLNVEKITSEHIIGMVCVFSVQWICINVVHLFNSQNRYMKEQEQSMDDMLRILEVKCQEARQATQSKSDFLSNMSHEIRTPINSVLGMNEMILRESRDENILDYASNIDSSGRMLLSLINDVLDFSKIESGKMEIVSTTYLVSEFLNDLINMLWITAKEKGLGFVLEIDNNLPRELFGDDVRLRQVLTNLLTNAIKYTEEGTVTLVIEGEIVNDFKVILHCEVRDTGIGIKEQDIPELFMAFRRVEEKKNRNILGTGLGLPITYHILEIMGSKLHVESEYGKGSVFSFSLEQDIVDETPISDFKGQLRSRSTAQNNRSSLYAPGTRVLVVDDNEMNRKVFVSLLKSSRIEVVQADSGRACIECMRMQDFDVVFLDHMMPELDGIETLHQLQQEGLCRMPVVALTANAVSGAREMYLAEGFDEFLSKPIMPDKLESLLLDMLPPDMILEQPVSEPDSPEWEELPVIDGIDWDFARVHFPNQKLLLHTIEDFYNMIGNEADKLENLLTQAETDNDYSGYQVQVHGMKSSAALIGILPLSGCAKILEDAAKKQDREVLLQMTPIFLREWRGFRERLSTLVPEPEELVSRKEDNAELIGVLGMLQGAAAEMDIDTMDEMAGRLPQYRLPDALSEQLEHLVSAVTSLESDKVIQMTGEWIDYIRK